MSTAGYNSNYASKKNQKGFFLNINVAMSMQLSISNAIVFPYVIAIFKEW